MVGNNRIGPQQQPNVHWIIHVYSQVDKDIWIRQHSPCPNAARQVSSASCDDNYKVIKRVSSILKAMNCYGKDRGYSTGHVGVSFRDTFDWIRPGACPTEKQATSHLEIRFKNNDAYV